ncbi:hypothetical protein ACFE04_010639 [Oxalis oulophora]
MATRNSLPNRKSQAVTSLATRTSCLCSPTNHPGSFRCNMHRNSIRVPGRSTGIVRFSVNRLNQNSIKVILLQLIIKPSCNDLQRRRDFKPKPSRFCLINGNRANEVAVI